MTITRVCKTRLISGGQHYAQEKGFFQSWQFKTLQVSSCIELASPRNTNFYFSFRTYQDFFQLSWFSFNFNINQEISCLVLEYVIQNKTKPIWKFIFERSFKYWGVQKPFKKIPICYFLVLSRTIFFTVLSRSQKNGRSLWVSFKAMESQKIQPHRYLDFRRGSLIFELKITLFNWVPSKCGRSNLKQLKLAIQGISCK